MKVIIKMHNNCHDRDHTHAEACLACEVQERMNPRGGTIWTASSWKVVEICEK